MELEAGTEIAVCKTAETAGQAKQLVRGDVA
jgi:hypothetical protein